MGESHKNNTGSTEYSYKDVDLNCIYKSDDGSKNVTIYSDFLFNYKSPGEKSYNYQAMIFNKKINTYHNGLTNEIYEDFIDKLFSTYCGGFSAIDCTKDHIEFGITDLGWDTIVDRKGNKIVVTYFNVHGLGKTATKKDIKDIKKSYEDEEYKCK